MKGLSVLKEIIGFRCKNISNQAACTLCKDEEGEGSLREKFQRAIADTDADLRRLQISKARRILIHMGLPKHEVLSLSVLCSMLLFADIPFPVDFGSWCLFVELMLTVDPFTFLPNGW